MKCPVCGAVYRPASVATVLNAVSSSPNCRRCKADLSDLLRLYDQAIWYYRKALGLLSQRLYLEAAEYNNQALNLYYSNADFHALAGKLWALQGEFSKARTSWQLALKFDPQNAIAADCLHMIQLMAQNQGC